MNGGAAVRCNKYTSTAFTENSIVMFANNSGYSGRAVDCLRYGD